MQTQRIVYLFLVISLLLLSSFSNSDNHQNATVADVIITLNVDTGQIERRNINSVCNFGQPESISNEDFTVEVNVGDVVIWQGISTNSPETDVVNIVSINHEGGKNVFGQNILKGNGENPEKVVGTVLYATPANQDYKYKISFTVMNNGVKRNGTFHIDPKIQSH